MGYNPNYYNNQNTPVSDREETIPYDLRQIYAINLVGEHLQDIARARKMDNYYAYFKCLKDLWVITQHKIKKNADEVRKKWNKLIDEATEIINTYPMIFKGKSREGKGVFLIEQCLNKIEMFLYNYLEEVGIFGTKWDDEGL
jgi:hypothetical protein